MTFNVDHSQTSPERIFLHDSLIPPLARSAKHLHSLRHLSPATTTALAPNKIHIMGNFPRIPLTIFSNIPGVAGQQGLVRENISSHIATWPRAEKIASTTSFVKLMFLNCCRVHHRNFRLIGRLTLDSDVRFGGLMASTFRQDVEAATDAQVLKANLSPHWTGAYKISAVGPCSSSDTSGGFRLKPTFFYFDLPSNMPGTGAHHRVSVARCKLCASSHDSEDMPTYLPTRLTPRACSTSLPKNPPRTTLLRTAFRHPSSVLKWGRPSATTPSVFEVVRSWSCMRCTLDVTLRPILGAGDGRPLLSTADFSL